MRPSHLPTVILALCIGALAAYNLALEVQVRMVQHETAAVQDEWQAPEAPATVEVEVEPAEAERAEPSV